MLKQIVHKQGATFSYADTLAIPSGNWTGKSQVRRNNSALVGDGVVTIGALLNGNRPITVTFDASDTINWPVAILEWDIQFTDDQTPANVLKTETVTIDVKKMVTV